MESVEGLTQSFVAKTLGVAYTLNVCEIESHSIPRTVSSLKKLLFWITLETFLITRNTRAWCGICPGSFWCPYCQLWTHLVFCRYLLWIGSCQIFGPEILKEIFLQLIQSGIYLSKMRNKNTTWCGICLQ